MPHTVIAIVACQGRRAQETFDDGIIDMADIDEYEVFNLDLAIDMPANTPPGRTLTIEELHARPGFIIAVQVFVEIIDSGSPNQLVVIRDRDCDRNAPAFATIVCAVLNAIVKGPDDRSYNCAAHLLAGDYDTINDQFAIARDWANAPGFMNTRVTTIDRSHLPGYTACIHSTMARANFTGVWDWVDFVCVIRRGLGDDRFRGPAAMHGVPADHAPDSPLMRYERERSRSQRATSTLVVSRGRRVGPASTYVLPSDRPSQSDVAADELLALMPSNTPLEPWQSVSTDTDIAAVWRGIVIDHGVDDTAQYELFLLAQSSIAGRQYACRIISQVVGWSARRTQLRNPSAWVHARVEEAFERLSPFQTDDTPMQRTGRNRNRRGRGAR
jgi:hypothetical protein